MARKKHKKGKAGSKTRTQAERADKHLLYEQAVQCVEAEIDFVTDTFYKLRRRRLRRLREDFCGTSNTSCEFVKRHRRNQAWCVDIDQDVLNWGTRHNIALLNNDQQSRIHLINGDVMRVIGEPVEAVLAMNFSYWFFKRRDLLCRYFRKVHKGLVHDGIFFLDAFGGYEAFQELEESTEHDGFTYIWDQAHYNPITGDATMYIHFGFPDGSRLERAFTYDWRQWTLPELTELLTEAGFRPTVYWEGETKAGEGNGIYSPSTEGTADAGWIAYIVAEKI